jgi:hypothetical protein
VVQGFTRVVDVVEVLVVEVLVVDVLLVVVDELLVVVCAVAVVDTPQYRTARSTPIVRLAMVRLLIAGGQSDS